MLFVIYEFTRRGRLVEAVYSIWQLQIMLIYVVELDFSIALWTVLSCSVLTDSDIAVKRQLSWRASFETNHPPFKQKTRKQNTHLADQQKEMPIVQYDLFMAAGRGFFLHGTLMPKPTELNWFGDLWKILSLDWSPQSQRCFQIQILTSTKRPADPVGWVKRLYSIHRSCQ